MGIRFIYDANFIVIDYILFYSVGLWVVFLLLGVFGRKVFIYVFLSHLCIYGCYRSNKLSPSNSNTQVIYGNASIIDEYIFNVSPAIVKGINNVPSDFGIKFTVLNDGRITEPDKDNYIDIIVKFEKDYRRVSIVSNNRSSSYSTYYQIKYLKISFVHDGKVTEQSGQMFCYLYRLTDRYGSKERCAVDIMNAAIKEYKWIQSNYKAVNIDSVNNATKLN